MKIYYHLLNETINSFTFRQLRTSALWSWHTSFCSNLLHMSYAIHCYGQRCDCVTFQEMRIYQYKRMRFRLIVISRVMCAWSLRSCLKLYFFWHVPFAGTHISRTQSCSSPDSSAVRISGTYITKQNTLVAIKTIKKWPS